MDITMELLAKLSEWQAAGRRAVKIEKDAMGVSQEEWSVWIYDYEFKAGMFLLDSHVNQDFDKLILISHRESLQQRMAELDKKIGGAA